MIQEKVQEMEYLGQQIKVKNWIPYSEKIDAAQELLALGTVFDDESGLAYMTHMYDAAERFTMLKYYTDMDLSEYGGIEGLCQLMDATDKSDMREIENIMICDFGTVSDIASNIFLNVKRVFEHNHSLAKKALDSFGFLFDGKDITQSIAEARQVSEEMINTLGAVREKEKTKPIDFSQYAKK